MAVRDFEAERDKIQREIEALERSLGPEVSSIDVIVSGSSDGSDADDSDSGDALDEDLETDDIASDDGGQRAELCLQMNLVYQAVLQEKLEEVELLLSQNKVQQEQLLWEIAGRGPERIKTPNSIPANLTIGHFLKPYFKDKVTGLGPPANLEMKERSCHIVKTFIELNKKRWRTKDTEELRNAIVSDTLQRRLQPKLLKIEYLQQKHDNSKSDIDKKILTKQIQDVEQEIDTIKQLPEETLLGQKTDDHDWEKISNVNFERIHSAERICKIWRNHLHPQVNKEPWTEDEIKKLQGIAKEHNFVYWEEIAEELGTNRTAFQCLQQFQLNNKEFKRSEFTKEEDEMLTQFIQRMRVGKHIPYRKISYFMEGRNSMQLLHRWTKCIDPTVKKGPWSKEEDKLLLKAVEKYGEKDWYKIRDEVPRRTDGQCRERYYKALHKGIKKGKWSQEEEEKLVGLTKKYGLGHWAKVSREMTNRTGSQCLSKWKHLSRRAQKRKRAESTEPAKPVTKRAPRKPPQKIPQKRAAKKIKEEKLSEDESDLTSESSSSSFLTTSSGSSSSTSSISSISSSSSSCSSSSSSSEDEEESSSSEVSEESESEDRKAAARFLESVPDLNLWIPRKQSSDFLQKIITNRSSDFNRKLPRTKMRGRRGHYQFNTVLKGIAYPPSTDTITEDPKDILLEAKYSGHKILQIKEDDVRNILKWNTILCQAKLLSQPTADGAPERRKLRSTPRDRLMPLDRSLLVAVTPWVGNVFLPLLAQYKSPWDKQIYADAMRKKLSPATLTSTPIFTLLIQLFQIDVKGCLQVIQKKKVPQPTKQPTERTGLADALSPNRALVHLCKSQQSPSSGSEEASNNEPKPQKRRVRGSSTVFAPKPKTVSELLKEKRMQQAKAPSPAPKTILLPPRILVSPQIVVNQAYIPVASPAAPTGLSQTTPFVPACQAEPSNNTASSQISSESSNAIDKPEADVTAVVAQDAEATNKTNSVRSTVSPSATDISNDAQSVASPCTTSISNATVRAKSIHNDTPSLGTVCATSIRNDTPSIASPCTINISIDTPSVGSVGPTSISNSMPPIGSLGPTSSTPPIGSVGPTSSTPPIGSLGPTSSTPPIGSVGPTSSTPPIGSVGPTSSTLPIGSVGPTSSTPPIGSVGPTSSTPPIGSVGPTSSTLPIGSVGPTSSTLPIGSVGPTSISNSTLPVGSLCVTNRSHSTPAISSPWVVQTVPSFPAVATQQFPIQLFQSAMNPVIHSTTLILTPQGLIQIPIQAFFPGLIQAPINQIMGVSESSNMKTGDPMTNGTSTNIVSGTSTSIDSGTSTGIDSGTSSGIVPGTSTGIAPGTSGIVPGSSTGMVSGTSTNIVVGTSTAIVPGSSTGIVPGISTTIVPGTSTGIVPGTSTGIVPGTSTGVVPGTSTGVVPGTSTGIAPGTFATLVPGTPTTFCGPVHQQQLKSNGTSSSENMAGASPQLQSVQPVMLPTHNPPHNAANFFPSPRKYPVVKIAKVLPSIQPAAGTLNEEHDQAPAPFQSTTQTSTSSTDKILDLSLISLEDETRVRDWLQSKSSAAYLPPSVCTLKTFSRILLQKKTLEENAYKLVPHSDREGAGVIGRKQEILDNLVEEKLQDNPAFNLLKQRFLSAFTFTGLLAVFTPPQGQTFKSEVKSEVNNEDKAEAMDTDENDANSGGNAAEPTTQSLPNEREIPNPDSQTPVNVAEITGLRLRRRVVYRRSET